MKYSFAIISGVGSHEFGVGNEMAALTPSLSHPMGEGGRRPGEGNGVQLSKNKGFLRFLAWQSNSAKRQNSLTVWLNRSAKWPRSLAVWQRNSANWQSGSTVWRRGSAKWRKIATGRLAAAAVRMPDRSALRACAFARLRVCAFALELPLVTNPVIRVER